MLSVGKRFVKINVSDLFDWLFFFLVVELIAGITVMVWQTDDQAYIATGFVILENDGKNSYTLHHMSLRRVTVK